MAHHLQSAVCQSHSNDNAYRGSADNDNHCHTLDNKRNKSAYQEIGEWEFLQLTDEELIDTVKHGFFGDSELARIYYGTLRLGINLHQAPPGWIVQDKDTLRLSLPPIQLLDQDFIDEARTKAFFESGKWTEADRKQLYERAYSRMKQRS